MEGSSGDALQCTRLDDAMDTGWLAGAWELDCVQRRSACFTVVLLRGQRKSYGFTLVLLRGHRKSNGFTYVLFKDQRQSIGFIVVWHRNQRLTNVLHVFSHF